jgi:hypothetical protein
MGDIDKAVEKYTDELFKERYEGPEAPASDTCIVCGKKGTLTDSGWVENPQLFDDPEGDYWDGDYLPEADETKYGWVCSNRCLSQAAYDRLDDDEKKTLNSVVDACRVLAEYGERARKIFDREFRDYLGEELLKESAALLALVYDDVNDPPEWLNRPTAEDALRIAVNHVRLKLEYLAQHLGMRTKVDMNLGKNYEAADKARLAARAATLAIRLKEALNL